VNSAEPHLVVVGDPAAPRCGALLSEHTEGAGARRRLRRKRPERILRSHAGPVVPGPGREQHLADLLAAVDDLASRRGIATVDFVGPPPAAGWGGDEAMASVYARFGYAQTPWSTALVDLERDDETLLASFNKAARKAVRRADGGGIRVVPCTTWDLHRDLFLPAALGPLEPEREERIRRWWELDEGRFYRYLVALGEGDDVLATLGSFRFNGVATEVMSKRTEAGRAAGLPAQDLLHWEMFRIHRELGDELFDLAGFNPEPLDPAETGIRRFKEKWGGEVVAVPRFTRRTP
jgi:hypothetical protein